MRQMLRTQPSWPSSLRGSGRTRLGIRRLNRSRDSGPAGRRRRGVRGIGCASLPRSFATARSAANAVPGRWRSCGKRFVRELGRHPKMAPAGSTTRPFSPSRKSATALRARSRRSASSRSRAAAACWDSRGAFLDPCGLRRTCGSRGAQPPGACGRGAGSAEGARQTRLETRSRLLSIRALEARKPSRTALPLLYTVPGDAALLSPSFGRRWRRGRLLEDGSDEFHGPCSRASKPLVPKRGSRRDGAEEVLSSSI
mmetsp:Transcript_29826/g.102740  ORF Transcript_29826/g.102740 Transcript_29826/m.102740 type:complete len:255 (-) Transcript_29826:1605-2369(-)